MKPAPINFSAFQQWSQIKPIMQISPLSVRLSVVLLRNVFVAILFINETFKSLNWNCLFQWIEFYCFYISLFAGEIDEHFWFYWIALETCKIFFFFFVFICKSQWNRFCRWDWCEHSCWMAWWGECDCVRLQNEIAEIGSSSSKKKTLLAIGATAIIF